MATYSLYSGSGPALTSYGGPFQSGIAFQVTKGGCWFNAYRWWVPAGGDTTAQKFALWCTTVNAATGNALVSGSVVTSGTLTANAWNIIVLPTPVQLAPGAAYIACTGWTAVNGFPATNNQFASGDPFSAGITNGPLFAYSDVANGGSGTQIPPGIGAQGQFSANTGATDPSVYMPIGSSNSANFGIDVVVSDTAPSGYSGSYRMWPNFASVSQQNNNMVDLNDAYIVATEFTLSVACTFNTLWFYSPPTATQLPTQCAIWNVGTQTMVSGTLNTSPSWSGAAGSGWVSCAYSGVTLPAGDYKVSVWNAAASGTGTGWNAYTPAYWTTGAGATNLVSGPITMLNETNATSPGQSTYQTSSTTFLYPNTYATGTPGQNYWVDIEVTPPATAAPVSAVQQLTPPGRRSPAAFTFLQYSPPQFPSAVTLVSGTATLTGIGVMSANGVFAGSVSLAGVGTMSAAGVFAGLSSLAGIGAMTAAGVFAGGASLAGVGSMTPAGTRIAIGTASLAGVGLLSAAGDFAGQATLAGIGILSATGVAVLPGAATLAGIGFMTAAGYFSGAAALAGIGIMTATGTDIKFDSAGLAGIGILTATALVNVPGSASLAGIGLMTAAPLGSVPGSATLAGIGLLTTTARVTVPGASALAGLGVLGALAVITVPGSAALLGVGTLASTAIVHYAGQAALAGVGILTSTGQVISPVILPSVNWTAEPRRPRWRAAPAWRWACSPALQQWRIVMAPFPPIAAVSLECVNVTWNSDLDGTSIDPTGQTSGQPELVVQFAFPLTSGNYYAPAQPVTWYTASWLLNGTGKGYIAQCLVGPSGVVALSAGLSYDVWSKITGSPESPQKFAGVQAVY